MARYTRHFKGLEYGRRETPLDLPPVIRSPSDRKRWLRQFILGPPARMPDDQYSGLAGRETPLCLPPEVLRTHVTAIRLEDDPEQAERFDQERQRWVLRDQPAGYHLAVQLTLSKSQGRHPKTIEDFLEFGKRVQKLTYGQPALTLETLAARAEQLLYRADKRRVRELKNGIPYQPKGPWLWVPPRDPLDYHFRATLDLPRPYKRDVSLVMLAEDLRREVDWSPNRVTVVYDPAPGKPEHPQEYNTLA